ncbi:hypothetical protein VOLCADRAFT_102964 [Volvox carteri f. nagariensis]|uniref:Uncharacterized protein n=1 Tax=Volvox carteri f. nagariensis TaxID=3068 RepID=D8TJ27_VOLCA|nr:uncharacterized protein VOLCADRAFT_102964 [Volvox carteri f. nagariensis]EFJ52303.1 hypothetical protein VOLCADRAFT_102964 [Volvox carteri f. nagariensis]|eukprot:XP_002946376.1 hypothetical protein VOLCADRAFT_102964 [Volvox carteri f. nagariensis]
MVHCRVAFLALITLALSAFGGCAGAPEAAIQAKVGSHDDSIVCFVIRTYWAHGDTWGDKSLRRILGSLRNQTLGRWEALLVVMDNRPFPELRRIVRELNDSRIWVQAEWINFKYNPKESGSWSPGYHNKLYNLTDTAIRACPAKSYWVVATNGDNSYDSKFVETVFAAPRGVDVVAVNFYSRYQRPTALPCERFEEGEGVPHCKENEMRFCQTDLAASAYRLERLLAENRLFGELDPGGSHGANDGIMAQTILTAGWKVHYVRDRCLVNHSPSPQQCALAGGVWDDSIMYQATGFGGACVHAKTVLERMRVHPNAYELLELNVTFDRQSFGYDQYPFLELKCLRLADQSQWFRFETYGRVCAARVDRKDIPDDIPPHPWDDWVPSSEDTEQQGDVAEEGEEGEEQWQPAAASNEDSPVWRPPKFHEAPQLQHPRVFRAKMRKGESRKHVDAMDRQKRKAHTQTKEYQGGKSEEGKNRSTHMRQLINSFLARKRAHAAVRCRSS